MRILCKWCERWFDHDGRQGFFRHLLIEHPWTPQAKAVVAALVKADEHFAAALTR